MDLSVNTPRQTSTDKLREIRIKVRAGKSFSDLYEEIQEAFRLCLSENLKGQLAAAYEAQQQHRHEETSITSLVKSNGPLVVRLNRLKRLFKNAVKRIKKLNDIG
jgi:hypothetical protein